MVIAVPLLWLAWAIMVWIPAAMELQIGEALQYFVPVVLGFVYSSLSQPLTKSRSMIETGIVVSLTMFITPTIYLAIVAALFFGSDLLFSVFDFWTDSSFGPQLAGSLAFQLVSDGLLGSLGGLLAVMARSGQNAHKTADDQAIEAARLER